MSTSILILFAHPRYEKSRVNRSLLQAVEGMPDVTIHDLYELYPDFNVDMAREKELLKDHDVVIWHHPLYMYGAPAILKQWIDLVLEYGWAHGKDGVNLRGKMIFNTITAGGTRENYHAGGHNNFTVREFLYPYEQTAQLCKMAYLPPFVVHGTHLLTAQALRHWGQTYRRLLERITAGKVSSEILRGHEYVNDWLLQTGEVLP